MTAFITHCLKNARLKLLGLLAGVCLVAAFPLVAQADTLPAEISTLKLERVGDAILLSANVKFELPVVVQDALLKGVAIVFVAEATLVRERWYWLNKREVNAERHMRLAFQPLTRRWRLNVASGLISNVGLGMALNQHFETLPDALAAVQRLSHWNIADASEIDLEQQHLVEFRFRLDASQLPRPLQIGTVGQTDWDISVSTIRPLVIESVK